MFQSQQMEFPILTPYATLSSKLKMKENFHSTTNSAVIDPLVHAADWKAQIFQAIEVTDQQIKVFGTGLTIRQLFRLCVHAELNSSIFKKDVIQQLEPIVKFLLQINGLCASCLIKRFSCNELKLLTQYCHRSERQFFTLQKRTLCTCECDGLVCMNLLPTLSEFWITLSRHDWV
jgi:hypothetical protein